MKSNPSIRRRSARLLAAALLLVASSCGSGLVVGVITGSKNQRSNPPPEIKAPTIEIPNNSAPIFNLNTDVLIRALTIRNVKLDPPFDASRIRIKLVHRQLSIEAEQVVAQILGIAADRFSVTFQIVTAPFVAEFTGKPKRDLDVDIEVFLDDKLVAPAGRFQLLRPPEISQVGNEIIDGVVHVSVEGTTRALLHVDHSFAKDEQGIKVQVFQRNPAAAPSDPDAFRIVQGEQELFNCLRRDPVTGRCLRAEVSALAPSIKFPGIAALFVQDAEAGWNDFGRPVQLLYVPALHRVAPNTAPVSGGPPAVLLGSGLLPADNVSGKLVYDFDRVELFLKKGGASLPVSSKVVRRELSSDQQIFFHLPQSPDGLPGEAVLELRQTFIDDRVRVVSSFIGASGTGARGFRFGLGAPLLGPHLTVLTRLPIDTSTGNFFSGGLGGSDLALLSEDADHGQVTLLRSSAMGAYRQVGAPVNVVGARFEVGRLPSALHVGNFESTAPTDDLFVVSKADPANFFDGEHAVLRSGSDVRAPFVLQARKLATTRINKASAAGDFDGDGIQDVLVLNEIGTNKRELELFRSLSKGAVRNQWALPAGVAFDLLHVADLDGDGDLDAACATVGAPFKFVIARGNGKGALLPGQPLDYEPSAKFFSTEHRVTSFLSYSVLGMPSSPRNLSLAVARGASAPTQWVVSVAYDTKTQDYLKPTIDQVLALATTLPTLGPGIVTQIKKGGAEELVLSTAGGTGLGLIGYEFLSGKPVRLPTSLFPKTSWSKVPSKLERKQIWGAGPKYPAIDGLEVVHEEVIDQIATPVISIFPITDKGILPRSPKIDVVKPLVPKSLVISDFNGNGNAKDVAAAYTGGLSIHTNSGPGLYDLKSAKTLVPVPTILPETMQGMQGAQEKGTLAWLEAGGQFAVREASSGITLRRDVREYLDLSLRGRNLSPRSRILILDGNQDGREDAILWLVPSAAKSGEQGALVFLRGVDRSSSASFPFLFPSNQTGVLALRVSFDNPVAGNLLGHDRLVPGIECAFINDRRVEFFELTLGKNPSDDRFVSSATKLPPISMDRAPSLLHIGSFDGDRPSADVREDLALCSGGRVFVYINRTSGHGANHTGSLDELANFAFLGLPLGLRHGDLNGDGLVDLLVVGQRTGAQTGPVFNLFAGLGWGAFESGYTYPSQIVAPDSFEAFVLDDLDGNGMADLILGSNVLFSH